MHIRLFLALALASPAAAPLAAQTVQLQPGEALLEVQAEGQALVRPDTATFNIGVTSTGVTAREATDANSRQLAEVIRALLSAGIEQRQIRTSQLSVQPQFERQQNYGVDRSQIVGYLAQNSVLVTTQDLARAPDVVAAAFGAGANNVSGPNLTVRDQREALAAARRDALEKARTEAEAYADGLGMRITRVLRVSERGVSSRPSEIVVTGFRSGSPPPPPPPSAPPPPGAPIEAGEIMQTLNLWIDFAMTPR